MIIDFMRVSRRIKLVDYTVDSLDFSAVAISNFMLAGNDTRRLAHGDWLMAVPRSSS